MIGEEALTRRLIDIEGVNPESVRYARAFEEGAEPAVMEVVWGVRDAQELHADLGGIVFHDLRRTFATRLRASNVHPYDISYLLGHQIQGITKTYARESLSTLRQAIKALDEPWGELVMFSSRKAGRASLIAASS